MSPLMVGALNALSRAPLFTSILNTRPGIEVPAAEPNPPATYTEVPSAAGRTLKTVPTGSGANTVETLPVVASNASRLRRVNVVEVL